MCVKKAPIDPKKQAGSKINPDRTNRSENKDDQTIRAPVALQRVRLKPLLSFTYDKGKTSIEMLSNEYETIQYKVQYEDNNESCYSHVNSHQGGNSNSETMEIRSRKDRNDLDESSRAMIAANSSKEEKKKM